jgi:hypothetical protein
MVGRAGEDGSHVYKRVSLTILVSTASRQARLMHLSTFKTDAWSRLQAEAQMTFCEQPRYAVDARRSSRV